MLQRALRSFLRLGVLALLIGIGFANRAQASDPDERTRSEARNQYEAGARLYAAGQFLDAVQAFERAYALSGAKPLLFNIAQAYRLVGPGHCTQALDAYERYLAADPSASNRGEVEERILSMRACVELSHREQEERLKEASFAPHKQAAGSVNPTARGPRVDEPSESKPSRALPLTLTVGGSLLALGGVALYTLARVEYSRAEGTCPCPEGKYDRWERITRASYGLAAVGGASIASGLVWLGALRKNRYSLGIAPWRVRFTGHF
jgi:tetratricopeptide (TPR) repeat protein